MKAPCAESAVPTDIGSRQEKVTLLRGKPPYFGLGLAWLGLFSEPMPRGLLRVRLASMRESGQCRKPSPSPARQELPSS